MSDGLEKVSHVFGKVSDGPGKVSDGLENVFYSLRKVSNGTGKVLDGLRKVSGQYGRVSDDHGNVSDNLRKVTDGLGKVSHSLFLLLVNLNSVPADILQNHWGHSVTSGICFYFPGYCIHLST